MVWKRYANRSNNSSVGAYNYSALGFIEIYFTGLAYDGTNHYNYYGYPSSKNGQSVINKLAELASLGKGLNTYINKNKPSYSFRMRLSRNPAN